MTVVSESIAKPGEMFGGGSGVITLGRHKPLSPEARQSVDDRLVAEKARGLRVKLCCPPPENEPFTFYGTKNEPDPNLLDMAEIESFTEQRRRVWANIDKRRLLLLCPCVTEEIIENPPHKFAVCYEYHVTAHAVLCAELKSVIKGLFGLTDDG